mmetsp:Transcript_16154/g.37662  ORF Transcript_16154/g.37662 Transcript_16154/m.37662 type:complete len:92 (-) Transcript_16154:305-580(-)
MAAHVAEAPVTVEATATAVPVQHASKVDDTGVAGRAEVVSAVAPTECRRCGKIFTPGANASPGSAQYYRCEACTGGKAFMEDLPYAYCSVQ